jgi:hyaluronoglucosaminidase
VKPKLGVIEGYFGRSWSWEARKDVVSRLAPAGYSFFHYAPKIDARLRREWQELYSDSDAQQLTEFSQYCRSLKVKFGIGLTPFGAHLDFDVAAKTALKAKLKQLDSFGLDQLAILFDDMRGDFTDLAQRQADIISFCLDHSKASSFFTCPSYYSNDPVLDRVFGARPDKYLAQFGKLIDPKIAVYWTGEEVCSAEYSCGHLADIAEQLGRKVALWDNYPVNDGPRMSNFLHLRAFTGRPANLGRYVSHHAINPASQPVLTCIPALTLPMSYAQGDTYRYGDAFMAAAISTLGAEFAQILQADLLSLQDSGLDRIGDRAEKLRIRYSSIDHPAAREILDWLDGGYAITGEMLQTQ